MNCKYWFEQERLVFCTKIRAEMRMNVKKKVVIGMSGGVDSSVAAYLLKEQGFDVIGVTMQMWQDTTLYKEEADKKSCGISAIDDAMKVANQLQIPHHVIDMKEPFKCKVIDYFTKEYKLGRTPNPCIVCNRYIKWEELLKYASQMGADYIATGHYARICQLSNGRYTVKKSATSVKDQTYALYKLTQEQLKHTLMPIGDYTKDEIRGIAEKIGIQVAHKQDSMEICFIPDNDYAKYIVDKTNYTCDSGNFVDVHNNIIGTHKGIIHYTVGQRKGLGLSMGKPVFVIAIRPETNEVVIGDDTDVFSDKLYANNVNFMGIENISNPIKVQAKVRYSHKGSDCLVRMIDDDTLECVFDEPVRAITPGQAVVLYDGDICLGGGTIL